MFALRVEFVFFRFQVRDCIRVASYTIDFALSPDLDLDKSYVVEVNHLVSEPRKPSINVLLLLKLASILL